MIINKARQAEMVVRYNAGETLQAISVDYGLTGERVRQIIKGVAIPSKEAEEIRKEGRRVDWQCLVCKTAHRTLPQFKGHCSYLCTKLIKNPERLAYIRKHGQAIHGWRVCHVSWRQIVSWLDGTVPSGGVPFWDAVHKPQQTLKHWGTLNNVDVSSAFPGKGWHGRHK